MTPINQILTKGISLARKYSDGTTRVVTTTSDDVAKYVKACGKRSVLECKPLQGKINPQGLGVVSFNGQINFQNEESALKYISVRLHDALNRSQTEQFERVIAKRGSTIIGQGDGTHTDATKAFHSIKGVMERINQDVPRDLEVFHSHPDMFGPGSTTPLSSPDMGDIATFFGLKLKKIVAVNSKGEFNSIEVGKDFTPEKFKLFKDKCEIFQDEKLFGGLLNKYSKLADKALEEYYAKGVTDLPEWLCREKKEIMEKISNIERGLKKSDKVAKVLHEYYQQAGDYGMIYATNFSNLV